jgi:hypothetical protein
MGYEADGFGVHAAQGLRGHGFAGDFGLEDLPQPHVDVRKAVSEDGGELVVAVKPGLHQHRAGNEGIQLAAQEYARVGLGDDRIGVKVGSIGERCLFGGRSGRSRFRSGSRGFGFFDRRRFHGALTGQDHAAVATAQQLRGRRSQAFAGLKAEFASLA